MIGPINQYLLKEHDIITEFISCMKREMSALREGRQPDPARFARIFYFARNYADKIHHMKEEDLLFRELYPIPNIEGGPRCIYYKELQMHRPSVLDQIREDYRHRGMDEGEFLQQWKTLTREGHIVNPLLEEHVLGRNLTDLIEFELNRVFKGEVSDNRELAFAIYRYCSMLEEHIDKENTCFANTVDKYLDDSVQKKVVNLFNEFDSGEVRPVLEESLNILKELK